MGVIDAYVTNLGRYVEGHLDGEYLKLPTSTEEVQALLKRIHVDGVRYEEIFITDYETEICGLYDCLGEYESIDELNYLAAIIEGMEKWEVEKFTAIVDFGDYHNAGDLINAAQNLDCFEFYPSIEDEEDLGRFYIEEMCTLDVPEHLLNYIDYEAYGRDMSMDEDGEFVNGGYIVRSGDSFTEHYRGRADIPDEYRIFAYPAPEKSITKAIANYRQLINEAPTHERIQPDTHEER